MIAQVAGASAKAGLPDFLYFMAFLSLQLGILNLFPIPVLDGGHIFFLIIEMIAGRPLSIKKREVAQQIGFGMLILLMVYVFYNDIMRFLVR
jgi:regulator of sigma E protease